MTPALEVVDLRVELASPRGTVHAVNGVSFTVSAGQIHGIVGESGSGKSTLLRAILGMPPGIATVSGDIIMGGRKRTTDKRARRRDTGGVSIVFQEPMTALNPVMPVGRQIAEAPRVTLGKSRKAARDRALELMALVGIPDPVRRYRAYPHELSGGLRQRVLIAMALSAEPRVLLCDEPTTALDVTIQDQVLRIFRRIARETDVAVVYVTHDLAVVAQICESVSVMYAGQFLETGVVPDIFEEPLHPYTVGLIEALPDVGRADQPLIPIPGAPPDLVNLPGGCPFVPRCPHRRPRCEEVAVDLTAVSGERSTACIRYEEIFARPAQGAL